MDVNENKNMEVMSMGERSSMESVETVFVEVPKVKVQEVLRAVHDRKECKGTLEVRKELQSLKEELANSRNVFMKEIGSVGAKVIAFETHIVQALKVLADAKGKDNATSLGERQSATAQGRTPVAGKRNASPHTPVSSPAETKELSSAGFTKLGKKALSIDVPPSRKAKQPRYISIAEVGFVTALDTFIVGPFRLMCDPNSVDRALVDFVFGTHLDPSEVCVQTTNYYLTRAALATMAPWTCIEDNVISAKVDELVWAQKQLGISHPLTWFLPTDYSQAVCAKTFDMKEFVRQQNYRETYMFDFYRCVKINIPIHEYSINHWYLLVVLVRENRAEIWDPLLSNFDCNSRMKQCRTILQSLDKVLTSDIVEYMSPHFKMFESFSLSTRVDVNTQHNNVDCGAFIMKYMEEPELMTSGNFLWISHEDRFKIFLDIIKSPNNSNLVELMSKARVYASNIKKAQTTVSGTRGSVSSTRAKTSSRARKQLALSPKF